MNKHIDLNHSLEKYIIDHSSELHPVLKEIVNYNVSLGNQKKLQISISQAQFLQTIIKTSNIKKNYCHLPAMPLRKPILMISTVSTCRQLTESGEGLI